MYRIIMIGPQGSGKGTQAELVSSRLGLPAISAGELLRHEAAGQSELAQKIKAILNQGKMVPNEITNALIKRRVAQADAKAGFILDGYPRDSEQAEALDDYAPPTHVLALELSDEEAVKRLGGRRVCPQDGKNYHVEFNPPAREGICDEDGAKLTVRQDDKPEAIRERLRIYHTDTKPLLDLYGRRGLVHKINAAQAIERVYEDIKQALALHRAREV